MSFELWRRRMLTAVEARNPAWQYTMLDIVFHRQADLQPSMRT